YINVEVISFALKDRIRLDSDHQEKIAARSTTYPWLPFACDTNLSPIIDTCWYLYLKTFVACDRTLSSTICAEATTNLTQSSTDRTDFGRLDIKSAGATNVCLL